ncbi:MAG TPA: hypothetical protein VEX86_18920 [Longimicrobium sp.]|nr:hypothetical protein [Longimicrobium sp.]
MARSFVRTALATLAAVALAACGSATSSSLRLDITPERTQYIPGNEVVLTVRNLGDEAVAYSFCARALQRRTGLSWVTENFESVPCPAAIFLLQPGESVSGAIPLPNGIPGGIYRVYLPGIGEPADDAVLDEQSEAEKTSKSFEVKVLVAQDASGG